MVKYNGCDLLVIHIHILKKENCEYIGGDLLRRKIYLNKREGYFDTKIFGENDRR